MLNSSIWPIDSTLSGATTPGQRRRGSDSNEGVLYIRPSTSITGATPSDCLVPYHDTCAEMQSVYSTAPADWARIIICYFSLII